MSKYAIATVLVSLAVACSSAPASNTGATVDASPSSADAMPSTPSPDAASTPAPAVATCDMHRSGIGFDGACDTCMQAKCCEQTVACFVTDPECSPLHKCLAKCAPEIDLEAGFIFSGGGDAGGGGGGNGGGVLPTDPCRVKCNAEHPASVVAERAYVTCLGMSCIAECLPH